MDKKQYLYELAKQLKDLNNVEYDEALNFVEEYFEEAGADNEQQVISELGSPEKYAAQIKAEAVIRDQSAKAEEKSTKSSVKGIWMVILGICALPIAAPLLFAAMMVIFAVLLTIFAFVLAGGLAIVASIISFIPLVFSAFALMAVDMSSGLGALGISIVLLGIIIFGICIYYLIIVKAVPAILRFTGKMFGTLKSKLHRRNPA